MHPMLEPAWPGGMSLAESRQFYAAQAQSQHLSPRQIRNQEMDAPGWATICSEDQLWSMAQAEAGHAAAVVDPLLNGADSLRRLREHDGSMGS
jgi:hypothetical protein